jgi:hypothetical protein
LNVEPGLNAGGWGQVRESKEAVAMSSFPDFQFSLLCITHCRECVHDRRDRMLMPFCLFRPSIDKLPNKFT